MSSPERQIGIIRDIIVSRDSNNRFDLFFTDRRIAIIYVGGKGNSFAMMGLIGSLIGEGITALDRKIAKDNIKATEENMKNYSLDELISMEKRNCFYTYDEIEEIIFYPLKQPQGYFKFIILTEEFEGEFTINQEQFTKIRDLLSSVVVLKGKLTDKTVQKLS
jgi:hypothetical protein